MILDGLCAVWGWHRHHARRAVTQALTPRPVRPGAARRPIYDAEIIAGQVFCWAVLGASTGQRPASIMAELAPRLRRSGAGDHRRRRVGVAGDVAGQLGPPARAGPGRAARPGRSHTRPWSLLKAVDPDPRWAEWKDAVPGFVEIDMVGHEVGEQPARKDPGATIHHGPPKARIHRWVNDRGYARILT